jgi:hypothetical protein
MGAWLLISGWLCLIFIVAALPVRRAANQQFANYLQRGELRAAYWVNGHSRMITSVAPEAF